jgi:hypothetical protein
MQSKISFLYLVSIKSYKYRNLSCRKSRRNGINRNRRNRNQLILAIVQRMRFNGSQTLENNETNQKGNNSCGEMFTIMFFFSVRTCNCKTSCLLYQPVYHILVFDFVLVSRRATTKARKPGYQGSTKWCLVLGFVESNWKHSSHIRPHGKLVIRFDSNKSSQTRDSDIDR